MKVQAFTSKIYRFDFTPKLAKSHIEITTTSETFCGFDQSVWWIGVRWRINGLDNTGEEIIGYLSESRTPVEKTFTSASDDVETLRMFTYNSFVNVEMAFQDKLNLPYNVFGKPKDRPNFESMSRSLYEQLIEVGFYA